MDTEILARIQFAFTIAFHYIYPPLSIGIGLLMVSLTYYVNINWLWFGVFIGLNMIQSAFTKWCLLETILIKLGVKK